MARSACRNLVLAVALLVLGASGHAQAAVFRILHQFQAGGDGQWPVAAPIADAAGNLYGTTPNSGSGCGMVFRLAPNGTETVLFTFPDWKRDGCRPVAGLIADAAGNLYGTTEFGGSGQGCHDQGCGTVFKLAPDGTETVLHSFAQDGVDGILPITGLIRDKAGNLYGGTYEGGAFWHGVLFKIAPDGGETLIHSFGAFDDAGNPDSLIADGRGNLYGTTFSNGLAHCGAVCGTVFKVASDGTESLLHVFSGGADGENPNGRMVFDRQGNLYGTAEKGGAGHGTVFRLTPGGAFSVLHAFAGGEDGNGPMGSLAIDKNGNLYGATEMGGGTGCHKVGCGTLFRVAADGSETVLHILDGRQGRMSVSGLTKDGRGWLYGTAQYGFGPSQYGTVFKFAP